MALNRFVSVAAVVIVSLNWPASALEIPFRSSASDIEYGVVFARGSYPNATPWIANLDGSAAVELVAASLASYPKVANGTVVFMSEDYNGQGPGIYKMPAAVGAAVQKIPNTDNIRTANGINWDSMDIAPDGSQVIWAGPESGDYYQNHNVYVINIDGSGKTRIQRDTSKHFFNITWGEPDRVVLLRSSVGNAYTQRIHTMRPDGSGLTLVVAEFAQHGHIGGSAGRAVLTWTQAAPYLVTMNNTFGDMVAVPGPLYGYTFTSWHPTEDALFGSRGGNLYRIDRVAGTETQLVTGGSTPCYGGDVGEVSGSIETIKYVALGDSYSSGEGAGDYLAGTDTSSNRCHRSENAYSRDSNPFVEAFYGMGVAVDRSSFFACSGATTENLRVGGTPHYGETPQLEQAQISSSTDLLTLTIGGNDVQFADIVTWCMDGDFDCRDFEVFPEWPLRIYLPYIIQNWLEPRLVSLFQEAVAIAPNATILALGYPQLLSSDPNAQGCLSLQSILSDITPDEITFLRAIGDSLNDAIADAASEAGIHFAPVAGHFDGHEVCTENPWVNGIKSQALGLNQSGMCLLNKRCLSESFHPNELGHWAYSRAAYDYLKDNVSKNGAMKANGLPENPPPQPRYTVKSEILEAPTLGDLYIELVSPPICGEGHVIFLGQSIRLIGDGFQGGAAVEVQIDVAMGAHLLIGTATAGPTGDLDVVVTIPTGVEVSQPTMVRAAGTGANGHPRLLIETLPVANQPDADSDNDGVPDACDNCVDDYNPEQDDTDSDGLGDICDPCPEDPGNDADGDGICRDMDPCPFDPQNFIGTNGQCVGLEGLFWDNFETGDSSAWSSAAP